jgi:hypothetical protein
MAIQIVSGNLNTYGNNGSFENDPSTWGFGTNSFRTINRTSLCASKGLRSLVAQVKVDAASVSVSMVPCTPFAVTTGKKYIMQAKVRCDQSTPPGEDNVKVRIASFLSTGMTNIVYSDLLISEIKDINGGNNWFDLETTFEASQNTTISDISLFLVKDIFDSNGNALIVNGKLFVDEFEVYQYTEVEEDPDPDPEPEEDYITAYFSKNPIPFTKMATTGFEAIDNYRIWLDVRVEDDYGSGIFNSKLIQTLEPDDEGKAIFQLRAAFRNTLEAVPTDYQNAIVKLTDRVKQFRVYSSDLSGTDTEPESVSEQGPYLVLLGGLGKRQFPGFNFFTTYLSTNKRFLTWQPTTKYVDKDQEDYLNFFIYSAAITTIALYQKLYYDDNTDLTVNVLGLSGAKRGQLYQIPSGPKNTNAVLVYPEKNLVKYELWLQDQSGNIISEVRTYMVSPVRLPLTRFLMILNSLGAWEVHKFYGQAEYSEVYDRTLVQKHLTHDYESHDGEIDVRNVTSAIRKEFSSGFLTGSNASEWFEYLREIARCGRFYDITTGSRIPLNNVTKEFKYNIDQSYEYFVRIQAEDVYTNDSYTPESL